MKTYNIPVKNSSANMSLESGKKTVDFYEQHEDEEILDLFNQDLDDDEGYCIGERKGNYFVITSINTILETNHVINNWGKLLFEMTSEQEPLDIILDVSRIRIISSHALNVLLHLREFLLGNNRRFILCGLNGHILRVFQTTRLDLVFPVCESVDDAIRKY